jgi:WD40 repeat protein
MQVFELPQGVETDGKFTFTSSLGTPAGLAFGPDGRRLLVRCYKPVVLDTTDGRWWQTPKRIGSARAAAFVRGGRAIAHVTHNGLAVTDIDTGREERCQIPTRYGRGVYAPPGGETVYVLVKLQGQSEQAEIVWLDANTLEARATFARQPGYPKELVGSADGQWLATGAAGAIGLEKPVSVWDTADHDLPGAEPLKVLAEGSLNGFALSADGSHVATATSRSVALWDGITGDGVFASGKHRRGVQSVAFHPTRPLLASGDTAGNVFVWDFTGRVLTRYDWGLKQVYALTFSPDGLRGAAVDRGKLVVWDVDA